MFEWLKPKPQLSNFDRELLSSNIVGAKTLLELFEIEQYITSLRSLEIKKNPIQGDFDYTHLKNIHKHLFQDIYIWAGMDRYEIGLRGYFRKGSSYFTKGSELPSVSKALFDALKADNYFLNLKEEQFIKSLASFMNGLNILHPFREGNGRTQRIYIEELSKRAGYNLNLSKVSKDMMIQASIQASKGNLKGFEIIIKNSL